MPCALEVKANVQPAQIHKIVVTNVFISFCIKFGAKVRGENDSSKGISLFVGRKIPNCGEDVMITPLNRSVKGSKIFCLAT